MTEGALLQFTGVGHTFGALPILEDISFSVSVGEFLAIVGPSGCGKTTLLNLCSGWLQPSIGRVERRDRSRMVFQQDGLFPWLTVRQNIHLGMGHVSEIGAREARTESLLSLIGLAEFSGHYPHQLSGGMRQRVELARAMGGDTELLLLDEPFSALDYLTRLRLRSELAGLLSEQPRGVVLVTHDIEEAAQLADRVLVLTDRPARILDTVEISAPRPRDATQRDVVVAMHRVLADLGYERSDTMDRER